MKVIVLDMDETLYDERTFVLSGFREVSEYMLQQWGIPSATTFRMMCEELDACGRGMVFDIVLKKYEVFTKHNVRQCISVYRAHQPEIQLLPDAQRFLKRFEKYPLYVLSDGSPRVQRNKARVLGLSAFIKQIIITWQYGRDKSKPSPFCFLRICKLEHVSPENVVYISDDPHKDFVNLKPLGFYTIRIKRGRFSKVVLDKKYEAHRTINSLDTISPRFLEGCIPQRKVKNKEDKMTE